MLELTKLEPSMMKKLVTGDFDQVTIVRKLVTPADPEVDDYIDGARINKVMKELGWTGREYTGRKRPTEGVEHTAPPYSAMASWVYPVTKTFCVGGKPYARGTMNSSWDSHNEMKDFESVYNGAEWLDIRNPTSGQPS